MTVAHTTKLLVQTALFLLPWRLRRRLLKAIFKYDLACDSRIGFSIIAVDFLAMGSMARIGHLTLIKGHRSVVVEEHAGIGNLNWISAMPIGNLRHFRADVARDPSLHLKRHSAITNRHIIDCTDKVIVGEYTTVAGWRSQIITHGIDLASSRQCASPVVLGAYCFIGTNSTLLRGAAIPDFCVLGAGSVLTGQKKEQFKLYSGVPAVAVRDLDPNNCYFHRECGIVE